MEQYLECLLEHSEEFALEGSLEYPLERCREMAIAPHRFARFVRSLWLCCYQSPPRNAAHRPISATAHADQRARRLVYRV